MIKTILTLAIFSLIALSAIAQVSFGSPELINYNWKFNLSDNPNFKLNNLDDSKWRNIDIPHDWSIEGILSPSNPSCMGYLPCGIGWYRKLINIPADQKGKKQYIYFEGVYKKSEVFINGYSVGFRPSGYSSFMHDLTPYVKFGEANLIAVRVDHSEGADSRFYTGSGIYRNVYLVSANPVHIDQWGVFCETQQVTNHEAQIKVSVKIKNNTEKSSNLIINQKLLSANGDLVSNQSAKLIVGADNMSETSILLKVPNPKLWNLDNPYLYQLITEVSENGAIIDRDSQAVGIRTFKFDANTGFSLNGVSMKLKGVCIHHDAGCLGSAVPAKVWESRLQKLKDMGCNSLRMSHNIQAPVVYEICDRIGLLVQDEVFDEWEYNKNKWLTGWNNGIPGLQGSSSYFNDWSYRDARDMVLRDRNHPSIIMWSIGNEIDYPNDPYSHPVLEAKGINQPMKFGYFPEKPQAERLGVIAKRLVNQVKKYDKSRPVTAALAGVVMSNETEYPGALDIVGYNYTEDRYEMDHKTYPQRIIYGSENGQSMNAWKAVRDNDYIAGQYLWVGIDFVGEAGQWPSRGSQSGVLNMMGELKPNGHFREALWSNKPVTYIGTYQMPQDPKEIKEWGAYPVWNYSENEMIRVVCYTNCQQSKLMLNGIQIGDIKEKDNNLGVIFWDVPFKQGELKVIGIDNGKEVCNYKIETSARPFALIAVPDSKELKADMDLAQIIIQVVDEKGKPVFSADDEITCKIEGPAKLLGLESANHRDMGNYHDNVQRAYQGKLKAYIQTDGKAGNVKVIFSAPWLKGAEVVINIR